MQYAISLFMFCMADPAITAVRSMKYYPGDKTAACLVKMGKKGTDQEESFDER